VRGVERIVRMWATESIAGRILQKDLRNLAGNKQQRVNAPGAVREREFKYSTLWIQI